MKTYQFVAVVGNRIGRTVRRFVRARRGTVIIVVLALLGILAFIGFFALGFTSQENQSATFFSNSQSAKVVAAGSTIADPFFNDVLRQIINGASITEKQSVMWGGTHSLMPTMFGRDMSAFNGQGVNQIWNTALGQPTIDQNFN